MVRLAVNRPVKKKTKANGRAVSRNNKASVVTFTEPGGPQHKTKNEKIIAEKRIHFLERIQITENGQEKR